MKQNHRQINRQEHVFCRLVHRLARFTLVGAVLLAPGILGAASAPPVDAAGLPQWEIRTWSATPVRIPVASPRAAADLLALVPLQDFHREALVPGPDGWRLELRVTADEAASLVAHGVEFTRLPDVDRAGREATEAMWAERHAAGGPIVVAAAKSDAPALTTYPTHAEIGTLLADLAAAHPTLCRTFTWGQSVQGRALWGLVVSADVNATAAEPEVRLSSTMHGDEVVGMTLLVNLAHHLVENYGQPGYEDLTALVDGTEIHLLPLHNPDGYVAGVRANANSVDLNRNFPLPTGYHPYREVETLHFMAYGEANHFVLSQNGHGGALVVNYPWDHTYTRAPDDAMLIRLSLEYSTRNLPMYNGGFTDGITNGADWYPVDGGLQDWSYDQTGCVDLTVELSDTKWPAASSLAGYWDDNRDSLLALISAAHYGVHGVVSDSLSGAPLDAVVTVAGNAATVRTDPAHGDYYRLLDSGTYTLTFTADGYVPRTINGVATTWGAPTVLDVRLVQEPSHAVPPVAAGPQLRAWPNPFNPATRLLLTVPRAGHVSVEVFDLRGRRVRQLWDGGADAGDLPVVWDGRGDSGGLLPSGAYFARAVTPQGAATARLMLIK